MKNLLTLLCFFPLLAAAQDKKEAPTKKWSVGLTFSPDYSYRNISTSDGSVKFIISERNQQEKARLGYTTGININNQYSKRFSFSTGVLISDGGYKTYTDQLIFENQFNPQTGVVTSLPSDINNARSTYHYYYLDVPLKVNYYLLTGKVKVYISAGLSANIFLKERTNLIETHNDGTVVRYNESDNVGYSKLNLAMVAGFGIDYNLTRKIYLKAAPEYRRSITPIISAPINEYFYSAGLNLGVFYKF